MPASRTVFFLFTVHTYFVRMTLLLRHFVAVSRGRAHKNVGTLISKQDAAATYRLRVLRLSAAVRFAGSRPGRLRRRSAARRRPSGTADSRIHRGRLVARHAGAMARARRIPSVSVGNRSQRRMSTAHDGTGGMAGGKDRPRIRPARDNHRAEPRPISGPPYRRSTPTKSATGAGSMSGH